MAQFVNYYPVELEKAPARVALNTLFAGDAFSVRIGATVTERGQPVTLSGSVSAIVLCADGTKVSRTGSKSSNTAYITLNGVCYVPGILRVFLSYTENGNTVTLLEASGIVMGV